MSSLNIVTNYYLQSGDFNAFFNLRDASYKWQQLYHDFPDELCPLLLDAIRDQPENKIFEVHGGMLGVYLIRKGLKNISDIPPSATTSEHIWLAINQGKALEVSVAQWHEVFSYFHTYRLYDDFYKILGQIPEVLDEFYANPPEILKWLFIEKEFSDIPKDIPDFVARFILSFAEKPYKLFNLEPEKVRNTYAERFKKGYTDFLSRDCITFFEGRRPCYAIFDTRLHKFLIDTLGPYEKLTTDIYHDKELWEKPLDKTQFWNSRMTFITSELQKKWNGYLINLLEIVHSLKQRHAKANLHDDIEDLFFNTGMLSSSQMLQIYLTPEMDQQLALLDGFLEAIPCSWNITYTSYNAAFESAKKFDFLAIPKKIKDNPDFFKVASHELTVFL